jgi:hypothetical protein
MRPWLISAASFRAPCEHAHGPWAGADIAALGGLCAKEVTMGDAKTVPWPSAKELKRADERAAAANDALDRLSIGVSRQYRAYMSGEGKLASLSVEEYGRFVLYLESMELAIGSAMSSIERMKANLDEIRWEVVGDLEKAGVGGS